VLAENPYGRRLQWQQGVVVGAQDGVQAPEEVQAQEGELVHAQALGREKGGRVEAGSQYPFAPSLAVGLLWSGHLIHRIGDCVLLCIYIEVF